MKTADDCTYAEMLSRFHAEVHSHSDPATIDNMRRFMARYAGMEEGETIRGYERRTSTKEGTAR